MSMASVWFVAAVFFNHGLSALALGFDIKRFHQVSLTVSQRRMGECNLA